MVIYVNNKRDMGQTLVHLPKEMEKNKCRILAEQIKTDERTGAVYRYCKEEKLKILDYIIYRHLQEVDL